jgi:Peptidase M50B-like
MRLRQTVLIFSTLLGSWLGMQAVHELGHVLGAWITGGRVERVVLHPLTISRADVVENPHRLIVVWAGPLGGVLLPLLLWGCVAMVRPDVAFLPRFFAGFCLLANGLYLGVGSFDRVGDCDEMLQHGSPVWLLWGFGLLTVPLGFWLWHGQGRHFGGGTPLVEISRVTMWASVVVCLGLLALGFIVGGR